MPLIEIKGVKKTPFQEEALLRVARRYYRGKRDMLIRFSTSGKDYGHHLYDTDARKHEIVISHVRCRYVMTHTNFDIHSKRFGGSLVKLNEEDWVVYMLSTLLHELRHAQQCERNIRRYYSDAYGDFDWVTNSHLKYYYSERESDARAYEYKNLRNAVALYFDNVT